jgi:hypothetical protein
MTTLGISTQERDLQRFALVLQQLAAGRSNAAGIVTLAAGSNATIQAAPNCAEGSAVLLFPRSASAAAELAAGACFVSAVANRAFTVAHRNLPQTDRTFFYVCLG